MPRWNIIIESIRVRGVCECFQCCVRALCIVYTVIIIFYLSAFRISILKCLVKFETQYYRIWNFISCSPRTSRTIHRWLHRKYVHGEDDDDGEWWWWWCRMEIWRGMDCVCNVSRACVKAKVLNEFHRDKWNEAKYKRKSHSAHCTCTHRSQFAHRNAHRALEKKIRDVLLR